MPTPAPIPLQPDWVYGPVNSRRLGRSLGINLLPVDVKLCNMDCVYCQYDGPDGETGPSTVPTVETVLEAVEQALKREQNAAPLDAITLAGNGEPTLHPKFPEVVAGLVSLRDRYAPEASLCLLSNGSGLRHQGVRAALSNIDRPIFKLDAGTEELFRAINRPRSFTLEDLLSELVSVPNLILQAMFVRGDVANNTTREAVREWFRQVLLLQPREVQVTTVDRGTQVPGVLPVAEPYLELVASALRTRGIEARAFPCRSPERFVPDDPDAEREGTIDLPPDTLSWLVACPHHGTRAHLELSDAASSDPRIAWCSHFPDAVPAPCEWDCLSNLQMHADSPKAKPERPGSKRLPRWNPAGSE